MFLFALSALFFPARGARRRGAGGAAHTPNNTCIFIRNSEFALKPYFSRRTDCLTYDGTK
jgi:hypothetical protein